MLERESIITDEVNTNSITKYRPIIPPPPVPQRKSSLKKVKEDLEEYLQECEEGKKRQITHDRLPLSLSLRISPNICENKLNSSPRYHKIKQIAKIKPKVGIDLRRTLYTGIAFLNVGISELLTKLWNSYSQGEIGRLTYIQLLQRAQELSHRSYVLMHEVNE